MIIVLGHVARLLKEALSYGREETRHHRGT
jgi:hypothetical protein